MYTNNPLEQQQNVWKIGKLLMDSRGVCWFHICHDLSGPLQIWLASLESLLCLDKFGTFSYWLATFMQPLQIFHTSNSMRKGVCSHTMIARAGMTASAGHGCLT